MESPTTQQPTQSEPLADTKLFQPISVGKVTLKNRLVHAPTTRLRHSTGNVATDAVLKYYTDRATENGGLLTYEGTTPHIKYGAFEGSLILSNNKQFDSFKKIVDSVHSRGSYLSLQLAAFGRAAIPAERKASNQPYVGPSAIYENKEQEQAAKAAGVELREMTIDEIEELIKDFTTCAKRAVEESGVDFIEIHSANMFLFDQFLHESSNRRTDKYGGSIENRARILLDLIDSLIAAIGADHVGVKFSPYNETKGGQGSDTKINPIVSWGYILSELERRAKQGNRIAYISITEPRIATGFDITESTIDFSWPDQIWKGIIIRGGGYLHGENFNEIIKSTISGNDRTLIAFGRYFASNPDLAYRLKEGKLLTPYEREFFYLPHSNKGYNSYKSYGNVSDTSFDDVIPKEL